MILVDSRKLVDKNSIKANAYMDAVVRRSGGSTTHNHTDVMYQNKLKHVSILMPPWQRL